MSDLIKLESITDVHRLLGLKPPAHPLVSVIPINSQVSGYDYGDLTYVLGFYKVSLKAGISGEITYGRNTYDFQEGSVIFTKPGQAMSFGDTKEESGATGWILLFHPDLLRRSQLGKSIDSLYRFFTYDTHEALHLSENERASLNEIVRNIENEYQQSIDRHSQKLIIANLELLLDYCLRYYDRQFYVRSNLNQDLITRFDELLRNYFASTAPAELGLPTVKYCSQQLNMSPSYFSDLLKKETGENAQQHIQKVIVEIAKTSLLGTTEQVSQISYGLGFEYPQHFSKLFKSATGMSPMEYRKRN